MQNERSPDGSSEVIFRETGPHSDPQFTIQELIPLSTFKSEQRPVTEVPPHERENESPLGSNQNSDENSTDQYMPVQESDIHTTSNDHPSSQSLSSDTRSHGQEDYPTNAKKHDTGSCPTRSLSIESGKESLKEQLTVETSGHPSDLGPHVQKERSPDSFSKVLPKQTSVFQSDPQFTKQELPSSTFKSEQRPSTEVPSQERKNDSSLGSNQSSDESSIHQNDSQLPVQDSDLHTNFNDHLSQSLPSDPRSYGQEHYPTDAKKHDAGSSPTRSLFVESEKESLNQQLTVDTSSCLLYTSPSPRDATLSRMPSSA